MKMRTLQLLAFLILVEGVGAQSKGEVVEHRLAQQVHTQFSLPYGLVADAGMRAQKQTTQSAEQWQYLNNYSQGAKDALIALEPSQYMESLKLCKSSSATPMRLIGCGYADGFEAITKRQLPVTMNDFGYIRRTVYGEVLEKQRADLKFIQVRGEQPWLLGDSAKSEQLEVGACYQLSGYLSAEGGFGGRFMDFRREFIVLSFSKADPPCVDPIVLRQ